MNKAVKIVVSGFALYGLFATAVLTSFPDDPDAMDYKERQQYNKMKIAGFELGLRKQQVIDLLGSPDISEASTKEDQQLQVLFYRTQHKNSDGITTIEECTPLLFEDNVLVAWGETAYDRYKASL